VRFDLGDLASEVVPRMQALTKIHRLVLRREASVPVEADRERIEEVLVSLLDNAIKYSPQGGEVEVRVWAQEGEAVVSVKDHGVGISRERQPHIFEPFYEAVPSGAPGYRGVVALSLYLSKLAVERHKGRIWFESEAGKGSTFYFSLPLAEKSGDDGRV
jgi:signal transduction histidine kinase